MATADPISPADLKGVDFLVSHGYRKLLRREVLDLLPPAQRINLHISLLPWNRGADPNFWAFFDNTPTGVTIHSIEEGLDTGAILLQREVLFREERTLKTTYERLQSEILSLLSENWSALRSGKIKLQQQPEGGSQHRMRDLEAHRSLMADLSWDTPVEAIREAGRLARSS